MKDIRNFQVRMTRAIGHIVRLSLMSLSCLVLCGPNSSRGNDSTRQAPDGAAYARWKSCTGLIRPPHAYSTADAQMMLERPEDIERLLKNLKVVWEQDLLLRPSFYNEATLMKVLNGTKVTWNRPDLFFKSLHTELIDASVASVFPGIVAKLASNCSVMDYKAANGVTQSKVEANGFLNVEVASASEITLRAVRGVFGHEVGQSIDRGIDPHGNTFKASEKGSVVYIRAPPSEGVASSRVEVVFYFRSAKPQQDLARPFDALADEDRVARITMHDVQGNTVGN